MKIANNSINYQITKNMLQVGKPIPPELQEAIKEETCFTDWVMMCVEEGNKTSAYTIKEIIMRGNNVSEASLSTIERVIRFSITNLDKAITRKEKCKSVLKTYNRLNQITS